MPRSSLPNENFFSCWADWIIRRKSCGSSRATFAYSYLYRNILRGENDTNGSAIANVWLATASSWSLGVTIGSEFFVGRHFSGAPGGLGLFGRDGFKSLGLGW